MVVISIKTSHFFLSRLPKSTFRVRVRTLAPTTRVRVVVNVSMNGIERRVDVIGLISATFAARVSKMGHFEK